MTTIHRFNEGSVPSPDDDDERLGEAIEAYLTLAEKGRVPEPDAFAARYPGLEADILAALEGLEVVHGLVGGGSSGSGTGPGGGPGRNLESGRRIAGYRVVRELGRGGMGTVYEALHVGLDRPVALKVLGTHATPDSSARRRFLNEARTAAGLHHTHIVPVFDVGQVGGLCYYAMQRIEGSGLDRVIRHLRRTRSPISSGIDLEADRTGAPLGHESSSSGSQFGSRLSKIWVRVSSSLPWHRARPIPGHAAARPVNLPTSRQPWKPSAQPPGEPAGSSNGPDIRGSAPAGNAALVHSSDSTVSWGAGVDRQEALPQGDDDRSSIILGGMVPTTPLQRRDEDYPSPFHPPRGSAYFRWVAEVGLQAAEALAHAHHQGVIHRDVKPSNLLIDDQGTIWVTDFGLARRLADPGLTHQDSLLGTPRYMSPEQARTGVIDGRTDVYSLGATLYELLTLRPPFDGRSAAELLDQIGGSDPLPLRMIDSRIPRDLETIVLKSLSKRPSDRYTSASTLAEDLARFLNREPVRARRISPVGRFVRFASRHPGITAVSTVAASTVLAVATYAYVRILDERNRAVKAQAQAQTALGKTEEAVLVTRAAMRTELWRHASVVRYSSVPNRRKTGLGLLQQAAALEPDGELKQKLRDEAVEFLVLPEVEPQGDLATGPIRDLVFGPDGARVASLSFDGEELTFWDVANRRRTGNTRLTGDPADAGERLQEPAAAPRGQDGNVPAPGVEPGSRPVAAARTRRLGNGPGGPRPGRGQLAFAGSNVAVILPDGQGVRMVDPLTGTTVRDLDRSGRRVLSLLGEDGGKRLVTIELEPEKRDPKPLGPEEPFAIRGEYQVLLWNLERGDGPIATLARLKIDSRRPTFPLVSISPDGRLVAFANIRGTSVQLFSAEDGRPRQRIETQAELNSVALGTNEMLATASGSSIQLWDLDTSTFLTGMTSNQNIVLQMKFNPTGTLLATTGFGSQVELWDPVSHKIMAVLPTSDQVSEIAFSPDGKTLTLGGRATTTSIWKVIEWGARAQLGGFDARPSGIMFREDGTLAIGGLDGNVWFWRDRRIRGSSPGPPRCISIQPGGRPGLHTAPQGPPSALALHQPPSWSGEIPRDNASKTGAAGEETPERNKERERNQAVAISFDARGRLVAHDRLGLRVWPSRPGRPSRPEQRELTPLPEGWRAPPLARTADGRRMALVRMASIYLWDSEQPEKLQQVVPPYEASADGPSPHANDDSSPPTSTASGNGGSPPRRMLPPSARFHAARISPRGDRLYLLDDSQHLQVWDLEDGPESLQARRRELATPIEECSSLSLNPDGSLLALGDRSGNIILVDTALLTAKRWITPVGTEAEGILLSLAFSPDGNVLAAGSQRGAVFLWTLGRRSSPTLLARLPGQGGIVTGLAFDPSGRRLASCGIEPVVEIWDLDYLGRELERLGLNR